MKLILSKISLKNLTTLCLDVVNFENKIKHCNWSQSNIFIPNLIEFVSQIRCLYLGTIIY